MKREVKDVQIDDCFAQGGKDGETSSCQVLIYNKCLSGIQQRGDCWMLSERGTVEPLDLGMCKYLGLRSVGTLAWSKR